MDNVRLNDAPKEQPLNKACEPCRALKVRCLPISEGKNATCQRCVKFNRVCVYAPPHRKKQRKRTDTRVSELEKEILAMRNLLDLKHQQPLTDHDALVSSVAHGMPVAQVRCPSPLPFDHGIKPDVDFGHDLDIVDRGLVSMADARQLLAHYITSSVRHLPLVAICPDESADHLRLARPLLFKAIMTTASAALRPHLFTQLSTEIIKEYVQRVMLNGEKTMELVQAISITSAWYHPTDKWATLKFYEYITLASTMAMDIGLGDRDSVTNMQNAESQMERKRTLIACFTHSSVTAFGLRRPNTLPFSSYMDEILHELNTSPLAQDSDRLLAAFASLFALADEISTTFSLTDAGREGRYPDHYLQHHIHTFQQRLLAWKERYHIDNTSGEAYLPAIEGPRSNAPVVQLQYLYHLVVMILHEFPLHLAYPTQWFRPPHFLGCPRTPDPSFGLLATQYLPIACGSAQAMINIFTSRPVSSLRAGPNYMYAGLLLALVTLSAISLLPEAPGYALTGPLEFYRDVTQVERLLDASVTKIMDAAGRMEYRIPSMFAVSLTRLRKWLRWMMHQRQTNKDANDLPMFSLFAGPEDHPCLQSGHDECLASSSGEASESSPVAVSSPVSRSDTSSAGKQFSPANPAFIPLPRDVFSVEDDYNDLDFGWSAAAEQDFSSVLDPSLFEMDMRYLNMDIAGLDAGLSGTEVTAGTGSMLDMNAVSGLSDMPGFMQMPGPTTLPGSPEGGTNNSGTNHIYMHL